MKTTHILASLLIAIGLLGGCSREDVDATSQAVKESAAELEDAAEKTLEKAQDTMADVAGATIDTTETWADKAEDAAEETGEAIRDGYHNTVDAVDDAAEATEEKAEEIME